MVERQHNNLDVHVQGLQDQESFNGGEATEEFDLYLPPEDFQRAIWKCSLPYPSHSKSNEEPTEHVEPQPVKDDAMQTPDSIVAKRWGGVFHTPLPPSDPSEQNPRT